MTQSEFSPRAGVPLTLAPGLRLVLAPNASPMTERGTNTYVLGEGLVSVIDPGPADPVHLQAIRDALAPGERIAQIFVTHAHNDHSPAAAPLSQATGAPVLAFGPAGAGMSARMTGLADAEIGGGEGIDASFSPDEILTDGLVIDAAGLPLTAIHTPGHLGNHMCFQWNGALFSGDHVMGWAPSLVSPPDGDLTDFMTSLDRIEPLGALTYYPGHGAPIEDGAARVQALRLHRQGREASIREALRNGADSVESVTEIVYTDVPPALLPAAARNVLAHLIDLHGRELVQFDGQPGLKTRVFPN